MKKSNKPIVIASRRSPLARIQAQWVGEKLGRLHPRLKIEYRWVESQGDKQLDRSLADSGGKGLFVRALEQEILQGDADLAVHSLKDLPAVDSAGLTIAAVLSREDVRDCLVSHHASTARIEDLPNGAVVGTASPRRAAQLLRLRADLRIEMIRGNVETRINKVLEQRQHDATVLALAGLRRLGLTEHVKAALSVEQVTPAAGQGALAIQCRRDDHVTLTRCLPVNHAQTAVAVHAERRIVAALGGDCHSAIAVLAQPTEVQGKAGFRLRAVALRGDGAEVVEIDQSAPMPQFAKLVKQMISQLRQRGAHRLIRQHGAALKSDVPAMSPR